MSMIPTQPWLRDRCGFPPDTPDTPDTRRDGHSVWLRVDKVEQDCTGMRWGLVLVDDSTDDMSSGVQLESAVPPSLAGRMTLEEWTAFHSDVKSKLRKPERASSVPQRIPCVLCLAFAFCGIRGVLSSHRELEKAPVDGHDECVGLNMSEYMDCVNYYASIDSEKEGPSVADYVCEVLFVGWYFLVPIVGLVMFYFTRRAELQLNL